MDLIHGIGQMTSVRALQMQRLRMAQAQPRLSTGFRINRGADDPAGLIASINLDATIAALEAESDANQRAMQMADTADAAMGQVSDQLIEAKKLALANANDAGLSDAEKQANQLEIDSIMSGVDRLARTTNFNGTKLLDGTATISASGAELKVDALSSADIDRTDPDSIDSAIDQIATARGKIGAFSRHTLQSRLNQLDSGKAALRSAVSMIRDTNLSSEVSVRSRADLLGRAALVLVRQSRKRSGALLDLFA
jgi:flagellin-like hook-associated protein FlgL